MTAARDETGGFRPELFAGGCTYCGALKWFTDGTVRDAWMAGHPRSCPGWPLWRRLWTALTGRRRR